MRLISSERHPVEAKTELLTYCCTACDEYLVFPSLISKYARVGEATDSDEAARNLIDRNLIELFRPTAFDPETLSMLCKAYEQTHKWLHDNGQLHMLHDNGQLHIVNEVIAQRIIALAEKGERDPDRLCAGALTALGDKAH